MHATPRTIRELLLSLDAMDCPSDPGRAFVWPMNEACLTIRADDISIEVGVRGELPGGANLADLFSADHASCRVEIVPDECSHRYLVRVREFLENVCETVVALEDRFISFTT